MDCHIRLKQKDYFNMKKFRCYSENSSKFTIIKTGFPENIMLYFPLSEIRKNNKKIEHFFLLVPEKE
jgi:hypothetical protein